MITVVISAYNEEKNIKDCIMSAKLLADEVIVVDNSSSDSTSKISKSLGAIVYVQENVPLKIDLQKNYGFSRASQPWILSLDADERISPKLAEEIKKTVALEENIDGYFLPRKNIIFGKWIKHSIWWPDYQLRLFRKGKARFVYASVHDPIHIRGKTKHLSEPLVHFNYDSISQFVKRMDSIYTESEARNIISEKKKTHWIDAVRMPSSDFIKTYFFQKGYRDGLHGLVLSILQAFYMFLVFAKVWEKQGFYERDEKEVLKGVVHELSGISSEWKFWAIKSLSSETINPVKKIILSVSKRFIR